MSDFKIGSSDRGAWDREDQLLVKRKALRQGLSAQQAEEFVRQNSGSEVLIKDDKGQYSVYELTTSEKGKTIPNSDFTDDAVALNSDVAKLFGGQKAYVSTHDNVIRSFDIAGIELDSLDHTFVTAQVSLTIQDQDGIDSKSKNDLKGTLNGTVTIDRALLDYSVAQANTMMSPLKATVHTDWENKSYAIPIRCQTAVWDIPVGTVSLHPEAGGLRVEIHGLAAGIASLADAGGALVGIDVQAKVDDMIRGMCKDMGLKVESSSITEYKLIPDLQNSPLLKEIPLGNQKIKIEDIQLGTDETAFRMNGSGNLELQLTNAQVTASSGSNAPLMKATDKEGADSVNVELSGQLNNDFNSSVQANINLKVNVTPAEQKDFQARLQEITGQSIAASGKIEVTDMQVTAEANALTGTVKKMDVQPGRIKVEKLNLDVAGAQVKLDSNHGTLKFQQDGNILTLDAEDVTAKGSLQTPDTNVQIQNLQIDGQLRYDLNHQKTLDFKVNDGKEIRFSGEVTVGGQKTSIQGLQVKDANFNIDLDQQTLAITQNQKQHQVASLAQLKMPGATLNNLAVTGNLKADLKKQQISLDATNVHFNGDLGDIKLKGLNASGQLTFDPVNGLKIEKHGGKGQPAASLTQLVLPGATLNNLKATGNLSATIKPDNIQLNAGNLSFQGQLGDIQIDKLNGSGQLSFTPATGLQLKHTTIDASGKVGDFVISRIKGTGDLSIDNRGQLTFSDTKNLELQTGIGLTVAGNLKATYQNGTYEVESTSAQPAKINYQPTDKQPFTLTDVEFRGKMAFNTQTQAVSFSSPPGQALEIGHGELAGIQFDHASLSGTMQYSPSGQLVAAPLPGQVLTASGTIQGIKIENLQATGPITFDDKTKSIHWKDQVSGSLPGQGIPHLSTQGDVSLHMSAQGEIVFESKGGVINADFGGLKLENLKTDGQVIYNPTTQRVSFKGMKTPDFVMNGSINGHPIKASSSGTLDIDVKGDKYEISGNKLKLEGLVDGFVLESPGGASGKVVVSKDFSTFDVEQLNFDFKVDDIALSNQGGLFKATPNGYEINLSGNIQSDKEKLFGLMQKISSRQDVGQNVRHSIDQVLTELNQHFAKFEKAEMQYENLDIKFDKNFNLDTFTVRNNSHIANAQLNGYLFNKPQIIPMGKVDWVANVVGDAKQFAVKDGYIGFTMNDTLRDTVTKQAIKELEAYGLKNVKLEISPNGNIHVKNASYDVQAKLFGKQRHVMDLNTELKISAHVENNQLVISLDKLNVKNLLGKIASAVVDGKDMVADNIAESLKQSKLDFNRKNRKGVADPDDGTLFTIDLQSYVSKFMDPGLQLKEVAWSEQGEVRVDYTYQSPAK